MNHTELIEIERRAKDARKFNEPEEIRDSQSDVYELCDALREAWDKIEELEERLEAN